jgi:hypothetical protein
MRRAWIVLLTLGAGSTLVGISLLRVTHWDYSSCQGRTTCDPRLDLPYANLAFGLTLLGILAVFIALVPAVFSLIASLQDRVATRTARRND